MRIVVISSAISLLIFGVIAGSPITGFAQPVPLPTWPEGESLVATATTTTVDLRWPVAAGAETYKIFQNGLNDCVHGENDCVEIESLSYRNLTTIVPDLTPGKFYFFWVEACHTNGTVCTSERNLDMTVQVTTPDTEPAAEPGSLPPVTPGPERARVEVGSYAVGLITKSAPVHMFWVTLEGGKIYTIWTELIGSLVDSELYLLDTEGPRNSNTMITV